VLSVIIILCDESLDSEIIAVCIEVVFSVKASTVHSRLCEVDDDHVMSYE
jgi:hypothetical protein